MYLLQDGGGYTADGELPEVVSLSVSSDRELKSELDRIQAALAATGDWDKRVAAMLRLEGLLKGGAGGYEAFAEMLRPLRDPLTVQLSDRRSAVSRQACHLLGCLAAALGPKFDQYASTFVPAVFKVGWAGLGCLCCVLMQACQTSELPKLHPLVP